MDLLYNCNALTVTQVSSLLLEGNLFEMKALADLEVKMVPMMVMMMGVGVVVNMNPLLLPSLGKDHR